jgi:hypothetical protein
MITYFQTVTNTSKPFYVPLEKALQRIKEGKSQQIVEEVRALTQKDARNEKKKLLPAICFSGKFEKRADTACIEHSGIICLDFDGFDDQQALDDKRFELQLSPYAHAIFTSPSGDGLKMLVKIPADIENHKYYFDGLHSLFFCKEFDTTSKNLSRVCYESYDPDIYVNENSQVFIDMVKPMPAQPRAVQTTTIRVDDTNEIIRRLSIWWGKNYGMVPGQRNNNLYVFAVALKEFGIPVDQAQYVLMNQDTSGEMHAEIPTIVRSAYRDMSSFGTKFYEDTEKLDEIKRVEKMSISPQEDDCEEFWTKSSKGKVEAVPHLFRMFLNKNGFFKYYPPGSRTFVFVRVIDNLISDVNEDIIKDFVLDYLMDYDDLMVYNYFAMNTKFFQEAFLNFVPKIEATFKEDTNESAYLYYMNCAVHVTKDKIDVIDYKDLDGHVWEMQRIKRNFVYRPDVEECEFNTFVSNISGGEVDRIRSMRSTLGYLMHSHKPASYCPAVILNDEVISDNPEGGTGKGIFVNSINHMKKMVKIDGKGFSFQKSFPYQRVQVDTQVLVFDDVAKNFTFENLFSVITEGISLEKKNKDEIHVPFERSPKIVITTNYAIRGAGNSFDRRKWDLEFKQYYTKNKTPEQEFGHMLYSGWHDDEWVRFDNYMISNLQLYLQRGLMSSEFKNLKVRKLIAETSSEFYEWATSKDNMDTKPNAKTLGQDMLNKFTEEYPDYGRYGRYKISNAKFYHWLDAYGEFAFGSKPLVLRSTHGKQIHFIVKELKQLKLC